MAVTDRIEINPKAMRGKPVIRGTPVTVELLLRKLNEGVSEDELLDAYPKLTRADIKAAIAYAADPVTRVLEEFGAGIQISQKEVRRWLRKLGAA